MKEILLDMLSKTYLLVCGVISFLAYLPTIKDLYIHKKASANTSSYFLRTGTSLVAFLYSIFILPDLFFIIVSGMSFLACTIVLILSIRLKKHN